MRYPRKGRNLFALCTCLSFPPRMLVSPDVCEGWSAMGTSEMGVRGSGGRCSRTVPVGGQNWTGLDRTGIGPELGADVAVELCCMSI